MGCPTNAKQSMLVTTIPAALDRGATLLVQTRAQSLELADGRVQALRCIPVAVNNSVLSGAGTRVVAKHFVIAGGAINSPALLMRSKLPDPHGRLGQRTFLHPVTLCTAVFEERIDGWNGAPQTLYTDHFQEIAPVDGPIGYKLEAPPLHPVIAALTMAGFGDNLEKALKAFPHTQALLALLRDGFHAESPGGQVKLLSDSTPVLDYRLTPFRDGRRAACAAEHGRDPVRRRRAQRDAGARTRRALPQLGRGACRHQPALAGPAVADDEKRPRDGWLCDGRHARARRGAARRQALAGGQFVGARWLAVPDQHRRQSAALGLRAGQSAGHTLAKELSGRSVHLVPPPALPRRQQPDPCWPGCSRPSRWAP
jgi:hypothetical protein